jgi:hypothetical protein
MLSSKIRYPVCRFDGANRWLSLVLVYGAGDQDSIHREDSTSRTKKNLGAIIGKCGSMSLSSRDFQRAARQRLTTAEFLLENNYTLDATYLAGYAIECTLKALILESTSFDEREGMLARITSGRQMHKPETLGAILKDLGHPIPLRIVRRLRRSDWCGAKRYRRNPRFLEDRESSRRLGGRTVIMNQSTTPRWQAMQDKETDKVEEVLRKVFPRTDAYRFNSASTRVRVIDERFEDKSTEERDAMVEPILRKLPRSTQADIMNLLTLTPAEAVSKDSFKKFLANLEFEDPSRSML